MDILNFISWIASKRRVVTSAPDDALVPIGIRTETRDDKYTTVAIKKSDLVSSGFKYEIGQYVADEGGVIAHRWLSTTAGGFPTAGTVQNYLVVDINDLSSGAPFIIDTPIYLPTYYNKWDGNTNCINFTAAGGAVSGTAIYLCNISTSNGKDDWYLPAIDELSKIWHNRWEIGQGLANAGGTQLVAINSNSADYLSSTGQGESVYRLKPFYGYVYENDPANSCYVRAVRKFSI